MIGDADPGLTNVAMCEAVLIGPGTRQPARPRLGAKVLAATLVATVLVACSANDTEARKAAIQRTLDASPARVEVYAGYVCRAARSNSGYPQGDPEKLATVPHVHVGPVVQRPSMQDIMPIDKFKSYGTKPCRLVTWDSTANVQAPSIGWLSPVVIGRWVVDKIGEEQTGNMGKFTPFTAHFEANDIGKGLIAAGLQSAPADVPNGMAALYKDANGNWVAQV